jgi:hypothetical protein
MGYQRFQSKAYLTARIAHSSGLTISAWDCQRDIGRLTQHDPQCAALYEPGTGFLECEQVE